MCIFRGPGRSALNPSLSNLYAASLSVCLFTIALAVSWPPALAQESPPSGITAPSGGSAVLPVPQPQFGGVIGRKADESTPDFPKGVTAPKDAPNVLLIMTDDTGYGAASAVGGPIP